MSKSRLSYTVLLVVLIVVAVPARSASGPVGIVVLQTDFGLKDQAVAAMRGVIRTVDRQLIVDDLTHEIPAYDVWEAAYRLNAVLDYWPSETVFVSVVDPGVGTSRRSIVARLKNGQTIVTPDNGTLTLVANRLGLVEVREIDEHAHRLPGSERSYTFHGRDVYAYVAAQLASRKLRFDDVGPLQSGIVKIEHEQAGHDDGRVYGGIPVLDPQYGNVWTNIPVTLLDGLRIRVGDRVVLTIKEGGQLRKTLTLAFAHTFGDVPVGDPLLYVNSVGMLAVALNQKNFAATYGIASGPMWRVELTAVSAQLP